MDNFKPPIKIADLTARYLRNQLSIEEELELQRWLDADQQNLELFNKLINDALDDELLSFYAEHQKELEKENTAKSVIAPLRWWQRLWPFK